jgi:hypothetical protein
MKRKQPSQKLTPKLYQGLNQRIGAATVRSRDDFPTRVPRHFIFSSPYFRLLRVTATKKLENTRYKEYEVTSARECPPRFR